jgi:hypothetical protein
MPELSYFSTTVLFPKHLLGEKNDLTFDGGFGSLMVVSPERMIVMN